MCHRTVARLWCRLVSDRCPEPRQGATAVEISRDQSAHLNHSFHVGQIGNLPPIENRPVRCTKADFQSAAGYQPAPHHSTRIGWYTNGRRASPMAMRSPSWLIALTYLAVLFERNGDSRKSLP